ncbi:MAG: response regulator transcription factor [bacterium]|nr:response regulator transcription factor [bacterium]
MRLLVVEDDRAIARALRDGLVARGYAVDLAGRAEEADELCREHAYDCVILDLGLPDGDGLLFLRDLRQRGSALPILVLTARGRLSDRVGGLDAGADDYLAKPFAFAEVVARVRALLRRGTATLPPVLRVGDLEVDPARFNVRRAGRAISLTAKEFAILEYLARHAGELVTRSQLLDDCWDRNYDGLSNLVDVYICRVRRKLDIDGAAPLLHTVRGAGFVLAAEPPC